MKTERGGMGMAGVSMPGTTGVMGTAAPAPATANMMMVPRCTMTFEKVTNGMKIVCHCEDKVSAGMLQNLCTMMAGGLCSCCCMMNGMMVCSCNMTMGLCKCEPSEDGVSITCTSGDPSCSAMIQACCACMTAMMKAGCTCCVLMNNMPICCSC
jgi:hypothetical protein